MTSTAGDVNGLAEGPLHMKMAASANNDPRSVRQPRRNAFLKGLRDEVRPGAPGGNVRARRLIESVTSTTNRSADEVRWVTTNVVPFEEWEARDSLRDLGPAAHP